MDNLLFYTLLILLVYYFLVYLPKSHSSPNPPLTQNQSTQTETTPTLTKEDQQALEQTLDQLIKGIKDLEKII